VALLNGSALASSVSKRGGHRLVVLLLAGMIRAVVILTPAGRL
jgi:hypothetical protein